MIAGLEDITDGDLISTEKLVNEVPAAQRGGRDGVPGASALFRSMTVTRTWRLADAREDTKDVDRSE